MDKYDDLAARAILEPELDDPEQDKVERSRPRRRRAVVPFERIWWHWMVDRSWDDVLPPQTRLFLLIIKETGEGAHPTKPITQALIDPIGISRFQKYHHLERLETNGRIRVMREGRGSPIVTLSAEVARAYGRQA